MLRTYARALVDLEISTIKKTRLISDEHRPVVMFMMSTNNRRLFGLYSVKAAMDDQPIMASELAKEIGISRNACDQIISDAEGLGYIDVDRSRTNYRYIKATPLVVEVFTEYARWNSEYCRSLNMPQINLAIGVAELEDK